MSGRWNLFMVWFELVIQHWLWWRCIVKAIEGVGPQRVLVLIFHGMSFRQSKLQRGPDVSQYATFLCELYFCLTCALVRQWP